MDIGKYNRKIVIKRRSVASTSDRGLATYSLATVATVWAKVRQLAGSETEVQAQLVANRTYTFAIRYLTGILFTDEILFDGRTFQITNVHGNVDEGSEETILTATEQI